MNQSDERFWHRIAFKQQFLSKNGTEFQSFFALLMTLAHPGKFIKVKPGGAKGDFKCDGLLTSERMLFQAYAPEKMVDARTAKKISDDSSGAIALWPDDFDTWVFVHNSIHGLLPLSVQALMAVPKQHPGFESQEWSLDRTESIALGLGSVDREQLLGPVPIPEGLQSVRFEVLTALLDQLDETDPPFDANLKKVPIDKIEINRFSATTRAFIEMGQRKSDMVGEIMNQWLDPAKGDRIAAHFTRRYNDLRSLHLSSDKIFETLMAETMGQNYPGTERQWSALAVVTYLFESCDIFESV